VEELLSLPLLRELARLTAPLPSKTVAQPSAPPQGESGAAGSLAAVPPVVLVYPVGLTGGSGCSRAVLHAPPPPIPGSFRFHSAGREDVDVRMLGPGRPCLVEVIDCRSLLLPAAGLAEMAAAVNNGGAGLVAIRGLAPSTKVRGRRGIARRRDVLAACRCRRPASARLYDSTSSCRCPTLLPDLCRRS
jgi:hypothetical protein